jgi:hypothetical protein
MKLPTASLGIVHISWIGIVLVTSCGRIQVQSPPAPCIPLAEMEPCEAQLSMREMSKVFDKVVKDLILTTSDENIHQSFLVERTFTQWRPTCFLKDCEWSFDAAHNHPSMQGSDSNVLDSVKFRQIHGANRSNAYAAFPNRHRKRYGYFVS